MDYNDRIDVITRAIDELAANNDKELEDVLDDIRESWRYL